MSITLDGTNGLQNIGQFNSGSTLGFKNRIINGYMAINQYTPQITGNTNTVQGNGLAVSNVSGPGVFYCDRWRTGGSTWTTARWSVQQITDAPPGFANSIKATTNTTQSPGANDSFAVAQIIEGNNIADLAWGTSYASPVTVSFWVKSSTTGLFPVALANDAVTLSYVFTYTITQANTWQYVSATILGPTSGSWNSYNGAGIRLSFVLASGSNYQTTPTSWNSGAYSTVAGCVNLSTISGATFQITGVQLEKGSILTSFDYRSYNTEFYMCQRYYELGPTFWYGYNQTAGAGKFTATWTVPKRAYPITFAIITSFGGSPTTWYYQNMAATFQSGSNGYIGVGAGTQGTLLGSTTYGGANWSGMGSFGIDFLAAGGGMPVGACMYFSAGGPAWSYSSEM